MDTKLGNRIKEARNKTGLTQEALAKRLGIAYPTMNKYEKGHRIPDAELLSRMTTELNCDPGWLLTGEGPKYREERKEVIERGETTVQKDPRLARVMEKLEHIYKEGTLKDRAEVRGIIEEVYDIIIESEKKPVMEEAVQAAEEEPPKKKRRAAG